MIKHLREVGTKWMQRNADTLMWEGMPFRKIALTMSSETGSFGEHGARLAGDQVWIDASFLHALACHFRADACVWQEGMDQMIVGHSLAAGDSAALDLINIAMVNDLHFWGVQAAPDLSGAAPVDDNGDAMGEWMRSSRH